MPSLSLKKLIPAIAARITTPVLLIIKTKELSIWLLSAFTIAHKEPKLTKPSKMPINTNLPLNLYLNVFLRNISTENPIIKAPPNTKPLKRKILIYL